MAKIGLITPGVPGHWNPSSCVARALQAKGHTVLALQMAYFEEVVRRSGLEYCPIGEKAFPPERVEQFYKRLGALRGRTLLRSTISWFCERSQMCMSEAPELLRRAGVEFLLVDQVEPAGACVAERLGIPYVTLSNALLTNMEPGIPPLVTTWTYSQNRAARLRNRLANRMLASLLGPWLAAVNASRREWNLPAYRSLADSVSPLLHLSQQPECFDFPRQELPPQFRYCGPWHDPAFRPAVPFPYEKLSGRPLIYASMGTLQNRVQEVFREIAAACEGLDAQLVISLGGGSTPEQLGAMPGNPLVVSVAPQLELLKRATLTITHGGLNTVLESLSCGVPMVAVPVGNDQPGVAARVKWLGAGELLALKQLRASRLRPLITRVLEEPGYRQRAQQIQAEIQRANGVQRAAELIEGVLN